MRAPTTAQRLDGNEVIALDLLPLARVHDLLVAGKIEHALVVAAFGHLAFRLGALRRPTG